MQNPLSEVMFNKNMLSKYGFCSEQMLISKEGMEKFKKVLSEKYQYEELSLNISKKQTVNTMTYKDEWFIANVEIQNDEEIAISLYTKDYEVASQILDIFKEYELHEEENIIILTNLYYDKGDIKEEVRVLKKDTFKDIKKEYYPYMKTDVMFKQYTKSNENIMVITGEPGIGKTKLINLYMDYLLDNPELLVDIETTTDMINDPDYNELSVLHVKSEELLATDKFWNYLSAHSETALVILDDFDNFLAPRTNEIQTEMDILKNKFISNILSQTDGAIKSNIKFMITTNREVDKIDHAILRRGRAFDVLALRKLKNEEAKKIWLSEDLSEDDFDIRYKEEEWVIQAHLNAEITKKKTLKTEAEEEYLLEENISVLKKMRKANRKHKIELG